jgi:Phage integrase SAM-like domain
MVSRQEIPVNKRGKRLYFIRGNWPIRSGNTALSYFNKFKAVLKQAYKDELINTDLNARIQTIKATETKCEFLPLEEYSIYPGLRHQPGNQIL